MSAAQPNTEAMASSSVSSIEELRAWLCHTKFSPDEATQTQLYRKMCGKLSPAFIGDRLNLQIVFELLFCVQSRLRSPLAEDPLFLLARDCIHHFIKTREHFFDLLSTLDGYSVEYHRDRLAGVSISTHYYTLPFLGDNFLKRLINSSKFYLKAISLALLTAEPFLFSFFSESSAFSELVLMLIRYSGSLTDESTIYSNALLLHPSVLALGLLCINPSKITEIIQKSPNFERYDQEKWLYFSPILAESDLTTNPCPQETILVIQSSLEAQWPTFLASTTQKRTKVLTNFLSIIKTQSPLITAWFVQKLPVLISGESDLALACTALCELPQESATNVHTTFLNALASSQVIKTIVALHIVLSTFHSNDIEDLESTIHSTLAIFV